MSILFRLSNLIQIVIQEVEQMVEFMFRITHIRLCLSKVVRGPNDQKILTVFKIIPSDTNGVTGYKVTS